MTPTSWDRVKEVFAEASEMPAPQRSEYLHRIEAEASDMAQDIVDEVQRLLKKHDEPGSSLDGTISTDSLVEAAARQHVFYPGALLAGRYIIRRFIAEGGMGEVYEAEDTQLGERFALKTLRPEIANQDHVVWLRREIQAARKVDHPNVCRVFDLVETTMGTGQPVVFMTMELLEGETLSARLKREGPITERQALPLLRQIAAALAAAHQAGIVHRDFKTGNVMIVPRQEGAPRVVVTDFGLSRAASTEVRGTRSALVRSSTFIAGTPAYMAPEQIQGAKVGPEADVYALGVVVYELLTGELPFGDDAPLKMAVKKTQERPQPMDRLAPGVRPNWNRAILHCLEPDPKKRYRDVRDVLADLQTRRRGTQLWRRFVKQQRKWFQGVAAAAGLAFCGSLAWWLWPAHPQGDALRAWESGVLALHSGEPTIADGRLEAALVNYRLPPIAHAQLAQALHEAGSSARSKRELAIALRKPFQNAADRAYARAVEAELAGDGAATLRILSDRITKLAGVEKAAAMADLAHSEESAGKPDAVAHWKAVLDGKPQYGPALLWMGVHASDTKLAERTYLTAENYFRAIQDSLLVRVVSARRGLSNLAAGRTQLALMDLPVLGQLPIHPGLGYGTCDRRLVLMAGVADDFAMPPDPVEHISKALRDAVGFPKDGVVPAFDEPLRDRTFWVSIPIPALSYCAAELEMKIRRSDMIGSADDTLAVGMGLSKLGPAPAHEENLWAKYGSSTERVLTNEVLVHVKGVVIHSTEPGGPFLDIVVRDDTTVDYIKLTLVY